MVRPKKHLGQHFLTDQNIARKIVESLEAVPGENVLEIGPGTGILTSLLAGKEINLQLIEIDEEAFQYLEEKKIVPKDNLILGDFLRMDLSALFQQNFSLIGNFPYNISSQIFFKVYHHHEMIEKVIGMVQKEVAERISSPPGNKTYGILSVLLQAFFKIEYLFTVSEGVFNPPPNVKSAVIRLTRKKNHELGCEKKLFTNIVKSAFNQRRKTLRNSLKVYLKDKGLEDEKFSLRPEQLSFEDFVYLTKIISEK